MPYVRLTSVSKVSVHSFTTEIFILTMQQPYTIVFIGSQGSGKGTQIAMLDTALKERDPARRVVDIQTGRRFRALAAKGEGYTEKRIAQTLNSGVLQPLFL